MEIIFVRHGQKEEIGEDPFLTKTGIKQAKHLAKRLKKNKYDEFYCSDMNRAKQTAEIVSKKIKLSPKIEKSLNEFESETLRKDKKRWNKEEKEHYSKLIDFLKKITPNPDEEKTILIIAHGITNRIIFSYFFHLKVQNLFPFRQFETAINVLLWNKKFRDWRLNIWNDNTHVPLKLQPEDKKNE
jgi:broad specificity phosphatase PhoE